MYLQGLIGSFWITFSLLHRVLLWVCLFSKNFFYGSLQISIVLVLFGCINMHVHLRVLLSKYGGTELWP